MNFIVQTVLLLLLTCFSSSYSVFGQTFPQTLLPNTYAKRPSASMPSTDVVIFPFNAVDAPLFKLLGPLKQTTLSNLELQQINDLLQVMYRENPEMYQHYYRQYISVLDAKNEKTVWVNGFCHDYENWKTSVVSVRGGGACFYTTQLNLSTGQHSPISMNASK